MWRSAEISELFTRLIRSDKKSSLAFQSMVTPPTGKHQKQEQRVTKVAGNVWRVGFVSLFIVNLDSDFNYAVCNYVRTQTYQCARVCRLIFSPASDGEMMQRERVRW